MIIWTVHKFPQSNVFYIDCLLITNYIAILSIADGGERQEHGKREFMVISFSFSFVCFSIPFQSNQPKLIRQIRLSFSSRSFIAKEIFDLIRMVLII